MNGATRLCSVACMVNACRAMTRARPSVLLLAFALVVTAGCSCRGASRADAGDIPDSTLPPIGDGLGAPDFAAGELDPASHGGTITFENIGAAGWYPSRRDPATGPCDAYDTNTCCLARHDVTSDALTPWDEDLILTLRGPLVTKQLAVYQPSGSGAWALVSAWDARRPEEAHGIAFRGNGTETAGFEPIVRVHAWGGILRHHGLTPCDQRHTPLGAIKTYVVNRLPSVYHRGADDLRALLVGLGLGATPAELGLEAPSVVDPATVDAFVKSLPADSAAIDTDAIARLDAPHRAWAVGIVLGALARADHRAPVALLALSPPGAAAAFDDVLAENPADRTFETMVREARDAVRA